MAECILVVDDQLSNREMFADALKAWGYKPVVAQDGFDALRKIAEHAPSLVISDLKMQPMSGFELLSVLARRFPTLPLICVSAEYDPADLPRHVVCDILLRKGHYEMSELRAKVSELLLRGPHREQLFNRRQTLPWIPKHRTGDYVITCTNCLRAFPTPGTTETQHASEHTRCVYCQTALHYFIEGSSK